MEYNYFSKKLEFGIALSIMALPLGWSYCQITGLDSGKIVDILMIISVICIIDLRHKPNLSIPKIDFGFCVYQLLVLLYIILTCNGNIVSEIIYNGFTLAIAFSLCIQDRNKKFRNLISYFALLGSVVIVVTFLYATDFFRVWTWPARFSLGNSGDPLTLSNRILIAIIALILWKPQNKYLSILRYILSMMGCVGLLATGVRKTFLIAGLAFLINIYYTIGKNKRLNKKTILKLFRYAGFSCLFILVVVMFISVYPGIKESLLKQFNVLINQTLVGIDTYIGRAEVLDPSAQTRVILRQFVFDRWEHKDNILQILFGHGYIETYVDIPYIQIFSDLGVIMGIIYVFYAIILVLKIILNRNGCDDTNIKFLKILAIPTLVGQFVSGVPYGYRLWLPIMYLLFLTPYVFKFNEKQVDSYE